MIAKKFVCVCLCVCSYVVVGLYVRYFVRKPACGRARRGGFAGIGAALPAKKVVRRNLRDKVVWDTQKYTCTEWFAITAATILGQSHANALHKVMQRHHTRVLSCIYKHS